MKRKLIAVLIGLLALSGIVGISLAQAGNDKSKQTVEQGEDDDANENESSEAEDGDGLEDEQGSEEVEDD